MFEVVAVQRTPEVDPETGTYGRRFPVVYEEDDSPNSTGPIAYRDTRDDAGKLAAALSKVLTMSDAQLDKVLALK
jgi:hypothetical protein